MRALIFDVDGTLAETEELHRQAFNLTFQDAGLDWYWSVATYTRLLKTTGGKERMRQWGEETACGMPDTTIAGLHATKTARYAALLAAGAVSLRPGIAELIAYARSAALRLAVATTTSRPNVDALCLACFQKPAADVFEVIAAGDEVAAKKPAPDVYLLALERLGLAASEAVALEDSRNGVLSAKAAGLKVVAAPSLYTAADDLSMADRVTDILSPAATRFPMDLHESGLV
ncbi:HAD-IA family hydrolase [Roseibium marinum]|uniref:HAD superfamily hydrolase (TIGR01509 family) n=1 Tax=Roseibium marinum TaxID=281252 RepID=A0A2S3V157_9HYPH|nr:HAD-IA family hydrolase [Roseibium marinum]POF33655.1 HAD superfamily hydrolase (TIGR01509 family) [Roseibium marinum]